MDENENQEGWVEVTLNTGGNVTPTDKPETPAATIEPVKPQEDQGDDEYGEKVRKRIAKEVARRKQADDRADAAIREAESLKARMVAGNKDTSDRETAAINTYQKGLEAKLEAAKKTFEDAYDAGDKTALSNAQQEMGNVQFELNALKLAPRPKEAPAAKPQAPQQQAPKLPQATVSWLNENPWFGQGPDKDTRATSVAVNISDELVEEGWDADSDEFYAEVEKRLIAEMPRAKDLLTRKPETRKPAAPVGGQSRRPATDGGNKVKLSQGDQITAKRLGVSLERFAANRKTIEAAGEGEYTPINITRRK